MIFKEIREDRDKWPLRKTNGVLRTKYTYPEDIKVCSIDLPEDSEHGYFQLIGVTDEVGDLATFKYWFKTLTEAVPLNETGIQLYKARYTPDTDVWQAVPQRASAPDNDFAPTEKNVWEEKDSRISKLSLISSAKDICKDNAVMSSREKGAETEHIARQWYKWLYE